MPCRGSREEVSVRDLWYVLKFWENGVGWTVEARERLGWEGKTQLCRSSS